MIFLIFNHILHIETIEIDPSLEEHKELLKRTDLISEVSQPDNQQVVRMHIVPWSYVSASLVRSNNGYIYFIYFQRNVWAL